MSVAAIVSGTLADGRKWRAEPDPYRSGQMVVTAWSSRGVLLGTEIVPSGNSDLEATARSVGGPS